MSQEKPAWVTNVENKRAEMGLNTVSSATSGNTTSTSSGGSYTPAGKGSDYYMNNTDGKGTSMSASDQAALKTAGDAYNNAKTDAERVQAHADAEAIRNKYNYSGGADGSQNITTNRTEEEARQNSYIDVMNAANKVNNSGLAGAASDALMNSVAQQPPVPPVQQAPQVTMPNFTADIPDFTGLLDKWLESAKTQQQGAIDYATQKGVNDLQRAEEDAQEKFQTQQNQIDIDEAKAKDNQALYAEARGDRGGIGAAQYGQIQATAMQNRRAVNSARTKLSTDTARAIADLRAQGEFEKADKLLQLTQTYLGQLLELQQWGMEYSLNVAQFNAQLQQWQAEFNMQAQQYADSLSQWQTEFNYTVSQNAKEQLAKSGLAALSVGIRPSKSQQEAMGYTDEQIDAAIAQYELAQKMGTGSGGSKGGSGGGGNGGGGNGGGSGDGTDWSAVTDYAGKYGEAAVADYLKANYKALGFNNQSQATSAWEVYKREAGWAPAMATRADAIAYMIDHDVSDDLIAGLMTESEWERRKKSYQQYGQGGAEVVAYNTYQDYLSAYAAYAVYSKK